MCSVKPSGNVLVFFAVTLAFVFNNAFVVESFNVDRRGAPLSVLKSVGKGTGHILLVPSSNADQMRLHDTQILYQRTRRGRACISRHYSFMKEFDDDEVLIRAIASPTDETEPLNTRTLESELTYRMAEHNYLLESTQLEMKENIYETTSSETESDNGDLTFVPEHIKASEEENERTNVFSFLSDLWLARFLVLLSAALYGTNFTVVKLLDETVPVGISTTMRFGIAALATLPWLIAPSTRREDPEQSSDHDFNYSEQKTHSLPQSFDLPAAMSNSAALMGFEVGVWNSIGYIAQAVGLQTTDASKSAFICSLAVVIVPILDFLTGKKLPLRKAVGAAMAIVGVGFLEFGGISDLSATTISSGDLLSLVQPLMFGIGFWRMEAAMNKFPTEASRLTAGQIWAVFAASSAYCLISGTIGDATLPQMSQVMSWLSDPIILGELFWTGTITTAFTVYMETCALKTLSAAETTLLFSTEPLWGAAFAAIVVGERFGFSSAMGAALILGGCIYSNLKSSKTVETDTFASLSTETHISSESIEIIHEQEESQFDLLEADIPSYIYEVAAAGSNVMNSTVHSSNHTWSHMAP